jgi:superfamily II DNA or RNA helicase
MFNELTGLNPRRVSPIRWSEFAKQVMSAQRRFWAAIHQTEKPYVNMLKPSIKEFTDTAVLYERTMPDAWLAGGVGVMRFNSRPPTMVTIHLENLDELIVIRNPSRDSKDSKPLTEDQEEQARDNAREVLTTGVLWRGCPPPVPEWKNATISMKPDEDGDPMYYLKLAGSKKKIPWTRAKELRVEVPIFINEDSKDKDLPDLPDLPVSWFHAASADGMRSDGGQLFMSAINSASEGVLRRLMTFIGNSSSSFSLPRISRGGGKIKGGVSVDDVGVFQLLLSLCRWFPSGLQYVYNPRSSAPLDFRVRNLLIMWDLRDRIRNRLNQMGSINVIAGSWRPLADTMIVDEEKGTVRKAYAHQLDIVAAFWRRKLNDGARGNSLIAPPGMGKTRIVCQYIAEQIDQKMMPPYLIYTLPMEAMQSVAAEWVAYGATVRILDPCRTSKIRSNANLQRYLTPVGTLPTPYTVTMVSHDHLRKLTEVLSPSVMSFAIFILDESHKALSDTQRTQHCLELSNAGKEFITMTGTWMIDTKFEKQLPWLAQIVSIPVTKNNLWVAVNGLTMREVDTGIPVKREQVIAKLSAKELTDYKHLMPIGLGGNNRVADKSSIQQGIAITEQACSKGVIAEAVRVLNDEKEPGVMIVAKNNDHADTLSQQLLATGIVTKRQVLVVGQDAETIDMTAANRQTEHPHVRVVIVPIRYNTGYNLSRFRVMITQVIPSNQATRSQIERRINRIGQLAKEIHYIVVVDQTGFWAGVLENHEFPRKVNDVLAYAIGRTR